jgi:signal transduction histidine kinase
MLQKAYNEKKPNWDKNIQKVMQTLLEQIDTLSNIASEFSSFAKMPKAENQPIAIVSVLEKVIQLYEGTENISLSLEQNVAADTLIFADEKQWQRAFTNLVQNGIQAIPDDRAGEIKLSISHEGEDILIKLQDNGTGIDEEVKEKIFVPNFTTKTTGMGLGLAMVRNIIESAKGEITFETEEGVGTTFYVKVKRWEKSA